MKRGKFKFLKLLNEYRSLKYELEYIRDILTEGHQEFEIYYRTWCAENNVDLEELNKRNQRKVDMIFIEEKSYAIKEQMVVKKFKEENTSGDDDFKKVFRSVARKLHPDTLKGDDPRKEEYESAFKRASSANESGQWGDLFDIVDQYKIPLKDYKQPIKCLEFDIEKVKRDIKKEKGTYSWLLHEAETKKQKENIVKRFLNQLFGWSEQ